jgi:membrane protein DedA with SNARE-associated domain
MVEALPTSQGPPASITSAPVRAGLLVVAVLRGALSVLAIPLAPVLWRDHFLALVLLRPTKEVFLAAGFEIRRGDLGWIETYAAAVPVALLGVWVFYFLGRSFAHELQGEVGLPGLAGRLLPATRIDSFRRILDRKGSKVVFLGRLAVFPSSLMAAAAGVSGVEPRRFLVADGLGAVVSVTQVLVAGYLLGHAYEQAGPWLTAVGAVVALGLLVALGRWLRREQTGD